MNKSEFIIRDIDHGLKKKKPVVEEEVHEKKAMTKHHIPEREISPSLVRRLARECDVTFEGNSEMNE